jgi:predicted unusual protein kinase regulating ubiquinone biosynthesis (AarF/ABC1/UbiB family)
MIKKFGWWILFLLKDRIPPFPTPDALKFIEQELGSSARKLFAEISDEPIAAASLGQVYKGNISAKANNVSFIRLHFCMGT